MFGILYKIRPNSVVVGEKRRTHSSTHDKASGPEAQILLQSRVGDWGTAAIRATKKERIMADFILAEGIVVLEEV